MRRAVFAAAMMLPSLAFAADLRVDKAMVPLAPPNATVHAAYMTLTNDGDRPVQIIGVHADGYAMAHLHQSVETDGITSMQAVHMVEIAPGQTVVFDHGGLHVMLMRPEAPVKAGDDVKITLEMADGETLDLRARVASMKHTH